MANLSLLEHEREVERSRAKLTQDLAVLCSSDTFAAFTDDLKKEAVGMKDAYWEKLKARAAANPAAVIAIGAGLAWRLIQRPPIASALIGVGLFSLWKTEPKSSYDAIGRRLDYMQQSKESLKEQAAHAFSAASDIAGKAQDAATAKGSEVWEGAKKKCGIGKKAFKKALATSSLTRLRSSSPPEKVSGTTFVPGNTTLQIRSAIWQKKPGTEFGTTILATSCCSKLPAWR